jgi:hypothetical protein
VGSAAAAAGAGSAGPEALAVAGTVVQLDHPHDLFVGSVACGLVAAAAAVAWLERYA